MTNNEKPTNSPPDPLDRISTGNFFLLRIPTLPQSFLDNLRASFDDDDLFLRLLRGFDGQIEEAIFLASASLYEAIFETEKISRSSKISLARYLYRMASRCTPFGAFAAVGLGDIGEVTSLEVALLRNSRRVVRLDQGVVGTLLSKTFQTEISTETLRQCSIAMNSSAWRAPDGWRYVETKRTSDWNHYVLSRIGLSGAVDIVQASLSNGPLAFHSVATTLAEGANVPIEEAENFLTRLVREQLVVAGSQVSVTADNPMSDLVASLESTSFNEPKVAALLDAQSKIDLINNSTSPIPTTAYDEIYQCFEALDIKLDRSRLVQVDLHLPPPRAELSSDLVKEIISGIEDILPLLARTNYNLSDFAQRFERRYGSLYVPLLEALDFDFGVGFGDSSKVQTPLLDGVMPRTSTAQTVVLGDFDRYFLDRLSRMALSGAKVIDLADVDLKLFESRHSLPSSGTILGSLFADNGGPTSFDLMGVFGPPAGLILGRFGIGNQEVAAAISQFQAEPYPIDEVIFAEIVHLPEGRVGNVVIRPVLSQYEIPYLGRASASGDNVLRPQDLELSIQDGLVVLRHRITEVRVIPRMSNAHNFDNYLNLPVYRFLAALARQGEPVVGWSWGTLGTMIPWKPEVVYKNLRLSRERWTLSPAELERLKQGGESEISALQAERRFGNRLRIMEGDNFIQVDLEHQLDRQLFMDACRRKGMVELEKAPDASTLVTDANGEGFYNEIAIPFRNRINPSRPIGLAKTIPEAPASRHNWTPGSEWLYCKIYCGGTGADQWLAQEYADLVDHASSLGCDRAFFIRYPEGGSHLRVRVHGTKEAIWGEFRAHLEKRVETFVQNGTISRFEYGTYQPEYDRYGGPGHIAAYEKMFMFDSAATAKALRLFYRRPEREELRWRYGLDSMARLALTCCGGDIDSSIATMENLRDGYLVEFNMTLPALDKVARKHRGDAWGLLSKPETAEWNEILVERDKSIRHVMGMSGIVEPSRATLMSLLHMCANRIFPESARLHELVVLHTVTKTLRSIRASNAKKQDD